jgi:hypothetical protein
VVVVVKRALSCAWDAVAPCAEAAA